MGEPTSVATSKTRNAGLVCLNGSYRIVIGRPEGRKYVGNWQDGKQHGKGIFITHGG
jgi:hypothetical protein